MRVYLPCTLPALARLLDHAELGPPVRGYAVTPALREWYASGAQDELEYVAMTQAARASLRLLRDDPGAPPRRVVLAVEVSDPRFVGEPGEPALVEAGVVVALRDVVSGHIDDPRAEADIRAAVAALPAAEAGDDDAAFTVDGAEGHELLWYAAQELRQMAGLPGARRGMRR